MAKIRVKGKFITNRKSISYEVCLIPDLLHIVLTFKIQNGK